MLPRGLGQTQRARWDNPDPDHIGGTGQWEGIRFASKSRSQQPLHPQNLPRLCTDVPDSSMFLCQWEAGPREQGGLLKWSRSSVGITHCPITNIPGHDLLKTQPHHQTPTSRAPKLPGPSVLAVCGVCGERTGPLLLDESTTLVVPGPGVCG